MDDKLTLIGRKPVLEALKKKDKIQKIYLQFGTHGTIIEEIVSLSRKNKIPLVQVPLEKIRSLSDSKESQGVLALKEMVQFKSLDQIISEAKKKKNPLLLILDSIQDTHNLGAIMRTAECSGVDGILITRHDSAPINQTVVKTSAGAIEYVNIALINSLSNTIDQLKKEGFWIAGTSLNATEDYMEKDLNIPLVLIVGNEEKGIKPIAEKKSDFLIKIPMTGKLNSLNVSVATGIILFEILRQKKLQHK